MGKQMRTWLTRLLVLLALLPMAARAFAADPGFLLDAKVGLNAYASLVEQEFAHTQGTLRVLASSDNAMSGNWDRIKGPLAVLAKNAPTGSAVWFVRPDGSYFTVESGLTNQNLKDRGYFPRLMAGKEVSGDLVISKSTGKRSAIIAVPVLAGGRVIGALGVTIALEKVAALVDAKMAFPENVVFYALDSHGETTLHRQTSRLFEFAAQMGSPTLTNAVAEMLAKPGGIVRYQFEGAKRTAIYKRSAATGWVFVLRW